MSSRKKPPQPYPLDFLPQGTWLVACAVVALTGTALLGWAGGLLQGERLVTLYFMLLGALLNVVLLALFLWLWTRINSRRERSLKYNDELRYLRTWSGQEGRLRKEGLIRDLNALGAVPRDLEQAALAEAELAGSDLRGCNLKGADLREADLHGAALDGADLWGADLSGADLSMASLRNTNLRSCNLDGASLVKAQLTGANLHRGSLVNANLHGSDLSRVRMDRARFAAHREGELQLALHSSVEDWIRERLDEEGYFAAAESPREAGGPGEPAVEPGGKENGQE